MKRTGLHLVLFCLTVSTTQAADYVPEYDVNNDGILDSEDLFILQNHWQAETAFTPTPVAPPAPSVPLRGDEAIQALWEAILALPGEYVPEYDFNGDGVIQGKDFLLLFNHWHAVRTETPFTPTPTRIPATPTETPFTPTPTRIPATPTETPFTPTPMATDTPLPTATVTPTELPDEIIIYLPNLPLDATPLIVVRVRPGSFEMGSNDPGWSDTNEEPVHTVDIGYNYYIGKCEITQAQWWAVLGTSPAQGYGVGNDYPVYYVSWDDCQALIAGLNALGQGNFRLPSEAEWEYACRAGTTSRFFFGDSDCSPDGCGSCELDPYAWWCGNNGGSGTPEFGSKPVGQVLPNPLRLYDMHGNVWEWCQDWWHDTYSGAPIDGSAWEAGGGTHRVVRSGYWNSFAGVCRSTTRHRRDPSLTYFLVGVRVVMEL